MLSSSFDLEHIFKKYGTIERVMICSLRSAIVVFDLIQSACNAATDSNALPSYYISVKWLPDYLNMQGHTKFVQ